MSGAASRVFRALPLKGGERVIGQCGFRTLVMPDAGGVQRQTLCAPLTRKIGIAQRDVVVLAKEKRRGPRRTPPPVVLSPSAKTETRTHAEKYPIEISDVKSRNSPKKPRIRRI